MLRQRSAGVHPGRRCLHVNASGAIDTQYLALSVPSTICNSAAQVTVTSASGGARQSGPTLVSTGAVTLGLHRHRNFCQRHGSDARLGAQRYRLVNAAVGTLVVPAQPTGALLPNTTFTDVINVVLSPS